MEKKVHEGIYGGSYLKIGIKSLKGFQESPTIHIQLTWCHVHGSQDGHLKGDRENWISSFLKSVCKHKWNPR